MSFQSASSWQDCHQCGRLFVTPGELTKHGRSCKKGKRRLSEALVKVKELYHRKKPRLARKDDPKEIGDVVPMDSQRDNGVELASWDDYGPSSERVARDVEGIGGDGPQIAVRVLLAHWRVMHISHNTAFPGIRQPWWTRSLW